MYFDPCQYIHIVQHLALRTMHIHDSNVLCRFVLTVSKLATFMCLTVKMKLILHATFKYFNTCNFQVFQ